MKLKSLILAVACLALPASALLTVNNVQTAQAESKKQTDDDRIQELTKFFEDYDAKRMRLRALERQLNKKLIVDDKSKSKVEQEIKDLSESVEYLDKNLEKLTGLKKIDPKSVGMELNTSSSDGSVTFEGTLYYDYAFTKKYLLRGDYEWKSDDQAYLNQLSGTGNVGGYEGFWVGLDENVTTSSTNAAVYDYYTGAKQPVTFYQSYSKTGRSWKWQDKIFNTNYNGTSYRNYNSYSGIFQLFFSWDTTPKTGDQVQYYAGYAHTWETTSINSIGVGPYSASVSWANQGYSWEDADQWIYTQ